MLPRVAQYTKTLGQGAAEGLADFKQGSSKQAQDVQKGLKIMVGAFGVAAAASGLLFATSALKPSPVAVAKPGAPTVKVDAAAAEKKAAEAKKEKEGKAAVEKAAAAGE